MGWVMAPARHLRGNLFGNVVLSRHPIVHHAHYDLSWKTCEPRCLQRVDVAVGTDTLHLYNVHLGTAFLERRHQAGRLGSIVHDRRVGVPKVVLGDFNEWSRGLATKVLSERLESIDLRAHLRRRRTYPGVFPVLHLDHIYYEGSVEVVGLELRGRGCRCSRQTICRSSRSSRYGSSSSRRFGVDPNVSKAEGRWIYCASAQWSDVSPGCRDGDRERMLGVCRTTGFEFPATISVNNQPFVRAPYWTRGGISGVVYVPSGEQWPAASTQVGAIVSSQHLTSSDLLKWMRKETIRQGEILYHESGEGDESCKVGADPPRIYVAVGVCKTGVARAACVEVDEALDTPTFTTCHRSSGYACFEDICNQQWLAWGGDGPPGRRRPDDPITTGRSKAKLIARKGRGRPDQYDCARRIRPLGERACVRSLINNNGRQIGGRYLTFTVCL